MRRVVLIAALLAGVVPPALAAELRTCTILEMTGGTPPPEQVTVRMQIEDGTAALMVSTTRGITNAVDLQRVEPGLSQRTVLMEGTAGSWRAIFNLVRVRPDGEVRTDSWVRESSRPGPEPVHIWTRLRC